MHVQNFSCWFIDTHVVCDSTGSKWRIIGFHGHPETCKREETWTLLESLRHSKNLPWLRLGDYNKIFSQTKKNGGSLQSTRQMDLFRLVIHHYSFTDLSFIGSSYTWSRNHPVEGQIHIRLNRALATNSWKTLFQEATVHHISVSTNDHSMLVVSLHPHGHHRQQRIQCPFRFEAMWLWDPCCTEVVQEAWMEGLHKTVGVPITNSLDSCRARLAY